MRERRRTSVVGLVATIVLAACAHTQAYQPAVDRSAASSLAGAPPLDGSPFATSASDNDAIAEVVHSGDPLPEPALQRDAHGPRCAGCPAIQPDPVEPIVRDTAAKGSPIVSSVRTTDPVVFVTIDDGEFWNEDAAVLLERARIPVTLFLTAKFISDKIPSMRRLTEAGAWVESHTMTHPNLLRARTSAEEICGPVDPFERAFGRRPVLFRPPYGSANGTTQIVAATCGLRAVVLWRASMNYGELKTQGGELKAGDIVLMHFRPDLADNLLELFRIVNDKGLRIGRLECYVGGDPTCGQPWR